MQKILVLEDIHKDALDLLSNFELEFDETNIADAFAVVIKSWKNIDSNFLNSAHNLKHIVKCGVGLDNIDIKSCDLRGIKIHNAPGSNANATAEHTIMLILAVLKDLVNKHNNVDKWERETVQELKGKTVGIVGLGNIGRVVAKKLSSFDVNLIGFDPYVDALIFKELAVEREELHDLIKKSDVITLHLPLTDLTENMISKEELDLMKGKYLINTSRGRIVDEEYLIKLLKSGYIAGAGLDVFHEEPFNKPELKKLKNVILTPHMGSMTQNSYRKMCVDAVQNFLNTIGTHK